MKRLFAAISTFLVCLMLIVPKVRADQSASSFASDITINQDTSLTITEKIQYVTDEDHHGIYRYIPYTYTANGLNETARVKVVSVTDENNQSYQYSTSEDNKNLTVKIGDPNSTFTGEKTYVITYQVDNALQHYQDHDELYWDITGEGWEFPLLQTTAVIHSAFANISQTACYAGPDGSDDGNCVTGAVSKNEADFIYPKSIDYNDNMTVVIGLAQPDSLIFPTAQQKLLQSLEENAGLALLALPGLIMLGWWWTKGRDFAFTSPDVFNLDPTQNQVRLSPFSFSRTPMVYEPLKDLTPGEAGTLIDESADDQDVIAEILELARKKYLKIEQTTQKKLFGSEVDYTFTQLKPADSDLTDVQNFLYQELFDDRTSVKLSDLRGVFYLSMTKAKTMLYQGLTDRKLFVSNPQSLKNKATGVVTVMGFVSFYYLVSFLEPQLIIGIPMLVVSVIVAEVSALHLSARTAVGHNLALQAKGLRETINRGKWREEIQEKHLFIENIFTYAVALGVVKKLAHDMEELNIQPPTYISGVASAAAFGTWVNTFSSTAASGMSYNPNSSSRGGGSGFSGGFSGGGGGGGGGGGW